MQSIEITGKSLAEATKAAAAKLGVDVDAVEVSVLEETKGLFGKSNVRISARAKEVAVAAPATPAKSRGKEKTTPAPAPVQSEPEASEPAATSAPAPEEAEKKGGRSRRGGRDRNAKSSEAPATEGGEEAADQGGPSATEKDAAQLCDLVKSLVESAGLEVQISGSSFSGRYVNIELDGRDVAHLVGKHGEVLNAMQYLVNIIAGKQYNNGIRATLDGNNYRQRREEVLYQLATRVAEEVRNRGEEAVLDALPAFERRIIHKSLSEFDGVQTYSEGEEPNRRVVIAPAD